MQKFEPVHAYENKKLKESLKRIAGYAAKVEPTSLEKAKAMIAVMRMSAEAALERFEVSEHGY